MVFFSNSIQFVCVCASICAETCKMLMEYQNVKHFAETKFGECDGNELNGSDRKNEKRFTIRFHVPIDMNWHFCVRMFQFDFWFLGFVTSYKCAESAHMHNESCA